MNSTLGGERGVVEQRRERERETYVIRQKGKDLEERNEEGCRGVSAVVWSASHSVDRDRFRPSQRAKGIKPSVLFLFCPSGGPVPVAQNKGRHRHRDLETCWWVVCAILHWFTIYICTSAHRPPKTHCSGEDSASGSSVPWSFCLYFNEIIWQPVLAEYVPCASPPCRESF